MSLVNITPVPAPAGDDFWVLAESACYLGGKGVTFGPPLLQPTAVNPGVYSISIGMQRVPGIAAVDSSLGVFADGSLDHVMVTPLIEACENPQEFLREAGKKLRVGGHLVVLVNVGNEAPGRFTFHPETLRTQLREVGHWKCKAEVERGRKFLLVLKKLEGKKGIDPSAPRRPKRACIARYGALGDAIIMTPLVKQLAEDGYEVTLNISGYCAPIFAGNPYVSNILIQERDLIPNHLLGRYWAHWQGEYDKYINLSESLEGDLLMVEGRAPFFTSKAWRHAQCNRNYYDYTMERGGYGAEAHGKRGELFFTAAEERRGRKEFAPWAQCFTFLWALNGSSHHKVYPMMEPLLREWLRKHDDARCITVGDAGAKHLEFPHWQLIPRAGRWSIRESLLATKLAKCVVGPETMMTNAAGCFDTPKIVLLSHSTRENLTKYFVNDWSLEPDQAIAPCYPCHSLHYTKESCPAGELKDTATGETLGTAPICALAISPERVMAQLDAVYAAWKTRQGTAA